MRNPLGATWRSRFMRTIPDIRNNIKALADAFISDVLRELDAIETANGTVKSIIDNSFPLCYLDHNAVVNNGHIYVFMPNTYQLLKCFCEAKNYFLSKEDIRQDVLFDEDAANGRIDDCIYNARKEFRDKDFPYEIETVRVRGYRLLRQETSSK